MSRSSVSRRFMIFSLIGGLAALMPAGTRAAADEPDSRSGLPVDRGLMQRMSNFTLQDVTSGRNLTLYGFQGRKGIALVFMGTDCPVGNLYIPRLIELNHEFARKGVVMLGINSNAHEDAPEVARFVKERGIDFPVLKDPGNIVADAALVERTCETIVLDGFARIRYRGAIDDQHQQGKSKDAADQHYLRDALTALVADKEIKVRATKVAGCLIDRLAPKPTAAAKAPRLRAASPEVAKLLSSREKENPAAIGKVSYAADVASLMQNKCQVCHRPGQVGPFALLTYDDARKHAAMIREVVEDLRMPPWHADPQYGHFANDRSLSAKERATLLAWVDQGAPLGEIKDLPSPRVFPEGWTIGNPDVVFELPEPYYVPAQGVVSYVYFRVPTNFKEDRWIQAAEAVPGDRSVVHHIIVYVMDSAGSGPERGRPNHFCGYAPGDAPSVFPLGTAKKIPAGADLLFQVHYTPIGRVRTDRSKVGMVFAKTKPTREAFTIGIANPDLLIPPKSDHVRVASSLVVPSEVRVLSFMPHMHLRGQSFQYTFTKPGETPEVVLSVPAYDFAWQTYYSLAEPIKLPKGTRIDCLAEFDNSEANPYNPDPSKMVQWGEQTFEEMMIGYLDLDVPVGTPIISGNDFTPRSQKATMAAIQAMRRLKGGNPAETKNQGRPLPSRPAEKRPQS
jgi:peroxiredoxin/mono/diheme cytochrome c family protein